MKLWFYRTAFRLGMRMWSWGMRGMILSTFSQAVRQLTEALEAINDDSDET